jgi:hypothetical protein
LFNLSKLSIVVFLLSGCAIGGESDINPIGSIAGGLRGGLSSPDSAPSAAAALRIEDYKLDEEYERHGATSAAACYTMAERFKNEGRKVKLVQIVKNSYNKGGGVLEWLCLFDGEDKNVEGNVFEDNRYNPPDQNNL